MIALRPVAVCAAAGLTLTLVIGCAHSTADCCPCAEPTAKAVDDKPEVKLTDLLWHETLDLAWWQTSLDRPLEEKVAPAPAAVSDYVYKCNVFSDYAGRALPADPDPALVEDVRAALRELPAEVQALLNAKLMGIFLVTDLGSSGFAEALFDENGQPAAGYLVLDVAALDRKANDWRTWMESSPFAAAEAGDVEIIATIEEEAGNNRKNALQYIMLHELGHVLTIGTDIHPPFTTRFRTLPEYRFSRFSWQLRPVYKIYSLEQQRLHDVAKVRFYAEPEQTVERRHLPALYRALDETSFLTLYGSLGDFEDFAEAFASYVHVVMLKRPYRVELRQGGEVIHTHRPCWGEQRCAGKLAFMEELIAEGPQAAP